MLPGDGGMSADSVAALAAAVIAVLLSVCCSYLLSSRLQVKLARGGKGVRYPPYAPGGMLHHIVSLLGGVSIVNYCVHVRGTSLPTLSCLCSCYLLNVCQPDSKWFRAINFLGGCWCVIVRTISCALKPESKWSSEAPCMFM